MTITFSWSERIETFLTKSCNLRLFYIKSWKLAYSFSSTLILYFGATEILYMVFSRFEEVVALCPLRIINEWLISFTKYMRGDMHQDKFVLMVSILLFVKAKNIQPKVNKVHREINTEFGWWNCAFNLFGTKNFYPSIDVKRYYFRESFGSKKNLEVIFHAKKHRFFFDKYFA